MKKLKKEAMGLLFRIGHDLWGYSIIALMLAAFIVAMVLYERQDQKDSINKGVQHIPFVNGRISAIS